MIEIQASRAGIAATHATTAAGPTIEPFTRAIVTVTMLRMETPPFDPPRRLPPSVSLVQAKPCTVAFYRYLYGTAGASYLWWMRRVMEDAPLAAVLDDPLIRIYVLYDQGAPAGFFEIDQRNRASANIAYFGLLPHAVGRGLGRAFLRTAVDAAWREGANMVTVNTSSADHPRALPTYLAAGFRPFLSIREVWDIPDWVGIVVPERFRI